MFFKQKEEEEEEEDSISEMSKDLSFEVETRPLRYDEEGCRKGFPVDEPDTAVDSSASEAYGELLKRIGEGGKYQWRVFFIASFCGIFVGFNNISAAFLAATPDFKCDQFLIEIGQNESNQEWGKDQCNYYETSFSSVDQNGSGHNLIEHDCESWTYDDSIYRTTVVTEWDLVCNQRWMMTLTQATYMMGVLLGAVVLSELSDMYGRRSVTVVSSIGFLVCGVTTAFSSHFLMFLILRFFVACFGSGIFLPNFVLVMEFVGPSQRTTMGMMYQGFFGVGFILLPGIAYFIRDWRHLQLAISIPSVLLLLYFKILPESPRWLLSQGEEEKALQILREIARVNGKDMPAEKELKELLSRVKYIKRHPETLLQKIGNFFKNQVTLLRTPILRRRCLIMFFSWFVVSMIYYGLSFSGSNINASIYLMVFTSGIVEVPSCLLACLTIRRYGRRLNISVCFIVCGIACILILLVPIDMVWLNITLASTGKFFNSIAFAIAYIYAAELVPTQYRNIAVGTSSMWARVGSTLAPFIVDLLGQVHYTIPSTVFGVLSLIAGLLVLLLPETGQSTLPETIEEVEAMKR